MTPLPASESNRIQGKADGTSGMQSEKSRLAATRLREDLDKGDKADLPISHCQERRICIYSRENRSRSPTEAVDIVRTI